MGYGLPGPSKEVSLKNPSLIGSCTIVEICPAHAKTYSVPNSLEEFEKHHANQIALFQQLPILSLLRFLLFIWMGKSWNVREISLCQQVVVSVAFAHTLLLIKETR